MTGAVAGRALTAGARDGRAVPRGAFAVTAAGGLLVSLDVSVANALMPAIGADFRGDGRAAVSWVITAYAIVFAAALVPAGRVADRAGRRRTYLGGLAVFGVGSVLCGVAPTLGRAARGPRRPRRRRRRGVSRLARAAARRRPTRATARRTPPAGPVRRPWA